MSPDTKAMAIGPVHTFRSKAWRFERSHTWSCKLFLVASFLIQYSSQCSGWAEWSGLFSHRHTRPTGLHWTGAPKRNGAASFSFLQPTLCNKPFTQQLGTLRPSGPYLLFQPQGQVKTSWNKLSLKGSLVPSRPAKWVYHVFKVSFKAANPQKLHK